MSCFASFDGNAQGWQRNDGTEWGKVKGTIWVGVFRADKGQLRVGHKIAAFFGCLRLPFTLLTSRRRKSNSATGGRQDWFSASHQDSVEPLAWQPTDLRSPSIVCLIDYFPSNYSCVTLNISLLQEGGKRDFLFWRTTFILSHLWAPNVDREEAHVKLKSGTGHQWWLVLIDCSVIPLCDRDSETIRASGMVFLPGEQQELNFFKNFFLFFYNLCLIFCLVWKS